MRIDVVIPVYRNERFLPEAMRSILDQKVPVSIVVVDDANQPPISSGAFAKVASIPSVAVVRRELNGGIGAARNTGLAHCRGDAVLFLDADDVLQPASLARMRSVLFQGGSDAVYGLVEEFGAPINESRAAKAASEPALMPGSTLMLRSSVERLGFFDETLEVGEFVDFMARAQRANWKFQPIREPVLRRRIHEKNTSWSADPADFLRVVRRHIRNGGDQAVQG